MAERNRAEVLSLIHTGTRFVRAYLKSVGINGRRFRHLHPADGPITDLKTSKFVCPLRDPALQLISCRQRNQTLQYRVEGWRLLASIPLENVRFIAVDQGERRFERLWDAAVFSGVEQILENIQTTERWAQQWPVRNSRGEHPLKDAYLKGTLAEADPEIWEILQKIRDIGPWLRERGYAPFPWETV